MNTFLLALGLVLLLIAGMSIGVIFGRKPISGSCGGVGSQIGGGGGGCSVCGRESGTCDDDAEDGELPDRSGTAAHLAYKAGGVSRDNT
nr:ApbE family protein [Halospina denitrificans]